MIRVVLVGHSNNDWRLYRQPQWMAEVRRSPALTNLPRSHFDVDESALKIVLDTWDRDGAGSSLDAAKALLARFGATEITGP